MLNNSTYPSPFSLDTSYGPKFPESGFDLKVNPKLSAIKQMSRLKYGRDVNIVNMDIARRADLDKKVEEQSESTLLSFLLIGYCTNWLLSGKITHALREYSSGG